MYDFTVPMAIVDFIPVALFLIAAIMLQHDLYNKMSKGCFALFAAGTIDVFIAGVLQALWKLLYAMGICDFRALNTFFLPAQSLGLLLSGLAVIFMLTIRQKWKDVALIRKEPKGDAEAEPADQAEKKDETGLEKYYEDPGAGPGGAALASLAMAPKAVSGTFVFIGMMILGLGMMCGGLSIVASKLKRKRAAIFFILSFVCCMGMGYLSSRDATFAWVNWAEQGINIVAQLALLIGTIILHRAGLEKFGAEEE